MRGKKARAIRKFLRDTRVKPKDYRQKYKMLKKESGKKTPESTAYPSKRDLKRLRKRVSE
jgi:hypothetical protein